MSDWSCVRDGQVWKEVTSTVFVTVVLLVGAETELRKEGPSREFFTTFFIEVLWDDVFEVEDEVLFGEVLHQLVHYFGC